MADIGRIINLSLTVEELELILEKHEVEAQRGSHFIGVAEDEGYSVKITVVK